ncbi:hypothetical protein C8Q70DRAFT_83227 [Cubamyces menziesii]|nr:hypothetical protein C8Q70DRAFT_83227 [Cubamyces menziesii]
MPNMSKIILMLLHGVLPKASRSLEHQSDELAAPARPTVNPPARILLYWLRPCTTGRERLCNCLYRYSVSCPRNRRAWNRRHLNSFITLVVQNESGTLRLFIAKHSVISAHPPRMSQISEVAQTDVAACAVGRWPARDPVVSLYTSLGGVCDGSDKILPVARSVVNSIFGGSGTENREGPPCAIGILPRKVVPFLLLACLLDPGLVTTPSFPTRLRGDGRSSLGHPHA